jgi:GH18 family chitinase
MQNTADSSYIWVDAADRYYQDNEAAREAGYCWSDEDDCWYHEDDCVFVEDLGDYVSTDEIGKSVMWDEDEQECVTKEIYEERLAEREQQSQEAA